MGDERKKAGVWPWIVGLLVGLPVLYVASFGPACWMTAGHRGRMTPFHPVMIAYVPLGMILGTDPLGEDWPSKILQRWATLMAPKGSAVSVPTRWNGESVWTFLDRRPD